MRLIYRHDGACATFDVHIVDDVIEVAIANDLGACIVESLTTPQAVRLAYAILESVGAR